MARTNRQRAKDRQAARRAARLADRGENAAAEPARAADPDPHAQSSDSAEAQFELEANAPPEELGRSDMVLEPAPGEPYVEEDEFDDPELAAEAEEAGALASVPLDSEDEARKGHATPSREADRGAHRERGKVLTFLGNVWAELQRVQWPNRQQVTALTGVVLGFVLIAGGYLGLLDAIFSRVIKEIL